MCDLQKEIYAPIRAAQLKKGSKKGHKFFAETVNPKLQHINMPHIWVCLI